MLNTCPFHIKENELRVLWEITSKCNMKCKHCLYYGNGNKPTEDLSLEKIQFIIKQLSSLKKIDNIWISGGEPLIRKDIVQICSYISQSGMHPSISTNGLLITPEMIKELELAGVKYIHLSMDGATPKIMDKLRGYNGAYNQLIKSLGWLQTSSIKYGLSFMVTPDSVDEVCSAIKIAEQNDVQTISFYLPAPLGRARSSFNEKQEVLKKKLIDLIESSGEHSKLHIELPRINSHADKSEYLSSCRGIQFLTITNDGYLGACPWLMKSSNKVVAGNIMNKSINALLEKLRIKWDEMQYKRELSMQLCHSCPTKLKCGKGCPSLCINDFNSPFCGIDPECVRCYYDKDTH